MKLKYDFVKEVCKEKGFELISTEYEDRNSILFVRCINGHNTEKKYTYIKAGYGCFTCKGSKKYNTEECMEICEKNNVKWVSGEYVNSSSKTLLVECCKGHRTLRNITNIRKGFGCNTCSGSEKFTFDYVKDFCMKKGFTLLDTEYKDAKSSMNVRCNRGHKQLKSFSKIQLYGCSECSGNKKHTIEFVKEEFGKMGFTVIDEEYKGSNKLLNVICQEGHKQKKRYSSIRDGDGCRSCNTNKSEECCREIVEDIFKKKFISTRPDFLLNKKTKYKLELDMYNEDLKFAIEYQGEQHYKPVKHWGGMKTLKSIQHRDKLKKELCIKNNVFLIEVPYIYTFKDTHKMREYIINELCNF